MVNLKTTTKEICIIGNKGSQLRPSPVQASPDYPHNTSILLYSSQKPYLNLESATRLLARPETPEKWKS